jgi:uncharacterized protein (TIGR00255 family)
MIRSMTAFASGAGSHGAQSWAWELRGVNGRGLDLRLRLPDGIDGLEAAVRAALGQRLTRGNANVTLRLAREDGGTALAVDPVALNAAVHAVALAQAAAAAAGVTLDPPRATDLLALRGVLVQGGAGGEDSESLLAALMSSFATALDDFTAMRAEEGRALASVIEAQLAEIARLTAAAAAMAEARRDDSRRALTAALRRLFEDVPEMDEARLAQELALIAVKSDVTEEIDRLTAHVAAARALIADPAPAGRKLDFLAQEFNREANTLCSKAQSTGLTRIGLDLKAVIDQMREQVQNVE